MGVDISQILHPRKISLSALSGKAVAIDAFNSLYQFLSIIRLPDGTPLRNRDGEVTSHLSGLFYRCINFIEAGMKPVFVFDGEPPALKEETIRQRSEARTEAEQAWKDALAAGEIRQAWTKATRASRLTGMMIEDSKRLLKYMGVPSVQAPSEGEAQAAYMVEAGQADAAASQDFDSMLFGCPRLIRNLAISGKRRIPKTNRFTQVEPEEILLSDLLGSLEITREQLVDMGIMIGTDYNPGIRGIGPKKAHKIIKKYGSIDAAVGERAIDPVESLEELRTIFLEPSVSMHEEFSWKDIDRGAVISFMCDRNGFSVDRIASTLDRVSKREQAAGLSTLDKWCQN
ncbi:MAG TPA: flap endonuclease-1 [Euryarchaeota archaeon]|nr:flap endonuclease-1 [Euryarchaeota archaeon]